MSYQLTLFDTSLSAVQPSPKPQTPLKICDDWKELLPQIKKEVFDWLRAQRPYSFTKLVYHLAFKYDHHWHEERMGYWCRCWSGDCYHYKDKFFRWIGQIVDQMQESEYFKPQTHI